MKKKNTYTVTITRPVENCGYPLPSTLEVLAYGIGWISHEVEKALGMTYPLDFDIIKIEKISWLLPQLWYIKDMNKTPYENKLHTENVRSFPNAEGQWKLVSTGEIVTAIEQEDIQGYPIMAVKIENEGTFYDVDFQNETFEKI